MWQGLGKGQVRTSRTEENRREQLVGRQQSVASQVAASALPTDGQLGLCCG